MDGGDDLAVTAGSQIIVVTAGAKQKPGRTRLDLAATNVAMARDLTPKLLRELSPDAVIVFVTNPVDKSPARRSDRSTLPPGRIFGSGTVRTQPLPPQIAERADLVGRQRTVSSWAARGLEISLWSSVSIGGVPADEFQIDGKPLFDRGTSRRSRTTW